MATPVNDRDVLIINGTRDLDPRGGKYIRLDAVPNVFHVSATGTPAVTSTTLTALLVNLAGPVTWSTGAGYTLTGTTDNVRTLTFANMTADYVEVTASYTQDGQLYTDKIGISKVQDGAAGASTTGPAGSQYATAVLYQWSAAASVAAPTGTSTYTWGSAANTSYVGSDGWYITPPANPGTAGVKLWVASRPITAVGGTATSSVAYNVSTTLYALSQNGANGTPGVKSATARAYQWATGAAPTATGTATFTYATSDYNTLPTTGWTKAKGNAPSLGYTLYEASVTVIDTAGATTSPIDWGTASIVGVGYVGTNGQPGVTGDSAAIAYVLVDGSSLNVTPATFTAAAKAKPTTGTWGETRAWADTPPTPVAGQSVFQSNGIYNSTLNQTVWGVPYLSNLRVGSLSAISANLGAVTAGSININNKATIDTTGNAVFKSIDIQTSAGVSILSSGGALNPSYAAAGTLNSAVAIGADGTLSGAGGGKVTIGGLGYSGDLNATNGAPTGTSVGGVAAATVATAVGAVNNATTGLAAKLQNGNDVLKGVLDVNTTYAAGLRVGTLTWGTNGVRTAGYGVAVTPYGLVGYKSDGTQTFSINASTGDAYFNGTLGANIVKANNIDSRGLDIKDVNGNVLFSSGSTLAQQARTNPNLCPSPRGMVVYGGATVWRNGDARFGDGQYGYLPVTADTTYCGIESPPLGIPWGAIYTVSFDVYCEGAAGRTLNVDVFNGGAGNDYDSNGIGVVVTNTMTRYAFSETMVASNNGPNSRLRMFTAAAGGSQIVIANIKVELGDKVTPWCSSVITAEQASTFIASAAIKVAHIDKASITNLSVVSQTVGMLRTATSGARIEISDNLIEGFNSGGFRRFRISAT